jgi:hypothetical protein
MEKIEDADLIKSILPSRIKYSSVNCKRKIFLDDFEIVNENELIKVLNEEYANGIYTENTKVRLKLLLNLSDYILLQSCYIPTLVSPLDD